MTNRYKNERQQKIDAISKWPSDPLPEDLGVGRGERWFKHEPTDKKRMFTSPNDNTNEWIAIEVTDVETLSERL